MIMLRKRRKALLIRLIFYDIGIAEIVLMPASNLVNQTIKESGFRDKFNVNVLGIRRKRNICCRIWEMSGFIVVMCF